MCVLLGVRRAATGVPDLAGSAAGTDSDEAADAASEDSEVADLQAEIERLTANAK